MTAVKQNRAMHHSANPEKFSRMGDTSDVHGSLCSLLLLRDKGKQTLIRGEGRRSRTQESGAPVSPRAPKESSSPDETGEKCQVAEAGLRSGGQWTPGRTRSRAPPGCPSPRCFAASVSSLQKQRQSFLPLTAAYSMGGQGMELTSSSKGT